VSIIGSHLRPFDLASTLGDRLAAEDCVGRSLAIIFYQQDGNSDDAVLLSELNALNDQFDAQGIRLIAVGIESIESHRSFAASLQLRFPLLADGKSHIRKMFPVPDEKRTTLFLDPSLKVVRAYQDYAVHGHARQLFDDAIAYLNREPARDILQHAPVLLVPNVLPKELCQRLIRLWETQNEDSGFMKQIDGKTVGVIDYGHKIRRDHYFKSGPDEDAIKPYIIDRVIPEIQKAFNYSVTRREDFRIASYDAARGGYFRPHRDNTTAGTAHRRFAMSLLLNDDYEGGYLRFPEFGAHRYRPAVGGAVVFSCSLLHEATDVTAGRRFVLLSFFYGEAEAKMREQYNQKTSQPYRA
jgi:peroxiredoxin